MVGVRKSTILAERKFAMITAEAIQCEIDACRGNNEPRALYWEGRLAAFKGNLEEAVGYYSRSAELGDPFGVCKLGRCYKYGQGVESDPERAFALANRAAEMGDYGGNCDVAVAYKVGDVVDQDYDKAAEYYEKAATAVQTTPGNQASALNEAARCQYSGGRYEDALNTSLRAAALVEKEPKFGKQYATSLDWAGFAKWQMGRYSEAKEYWEREQQALYDYGKVDESFDYDTDPGVARVIKNILAADGRIDQVHGVISGVVDMLGNLLK